MQEVKGVLLILTPQKWGVIFVLQMCKNLLIRLEVKRSKGSILYIYLSRWKNFIDNISPL